MASSPCGCGGSSRSVVRDAPKPRSGTSAAARAAQAAATPVYEVLNARGTPTGHKYTSLTSAAGHARRIGGTTRPVP